MQHVPGVELYLRRVCLYFMSALQPFKPLLKFFVFKTVIFLTFWQVG
jgi:hypothetical protein